MPTFAPTAEQANAVELFATGQSLAIEAGAGTGKTSTLQLLAEQARGKSGRYVAFNKSIATEAGRKFPDSVACSTAHSLAFRTVGAPFRHRLNSPRMKSDQIARQLGIEAMTVTAWNGEAKRLAPGFLAGKVQQAVASFCQSADLVLTERHFPYIEALDAPAEDGTGRRSWTVNREVARALLPAAHRAWADFTDPAGTLPYKHDHYLKLWHLSDPVIPCDFLLFDEAQDANPVLLSIVEAQAPRGVQLVFVGDSQQQIYEFTGAVNALANVPAELRAYLTQSFRFGPRVADAANLMLDQLGADLRIKGYDAIDSQVREVDDPDAVLCRTNAKAVETVLAAQREGTRCHLVGGGDEVARFAKAAAELKDQGRTYHPELACFTSWGEVQDYVDLDPSGSELRLLVGLVDDYGTDTIVASLGRMASESAASLVVSTAHKSKGREWSRVQLASDFAPAKNPETGEERPQEGAELRLLYVGVTRAQHVLDVTRVPAFARLQPEPAARPADARQWYDTATGKPIPGPVGAG